MSENKTSKKNSFEEQQELSTSWSGIFIDCDNQNKTPTWIIGLVFNHERAATKVFDMIRKWNNGSNIDRDGNITASAVQTDNGEINYFVYPNNQPRPYSVLSHSVALTDAQLPSEFPPEYEAGFLLQAFFVNDRRLHLLQDIQPIMGYGFKYSLYAELTSQDIERFLLRFDPGTILACEPYSLQLPQKDDGYDQIKTLQREYFAIIDEFFQKIAGTSALNVNSEEEVLSLVKERMNRQLAPKDDPFLWVRDKLLSFHFTFREEMDQMPKNIGGTKLLIGGGRFTESYATAIQRTILYADTVLVPDPLLPWFEEEREEERFRRIPLLQQTYHLLRYKSLVDAELPYPALLVFPTWERTQLAPEAPMRSEVNQFFLKFMSHYVGTTFESKEELLNFTQIHEKDFLQAVETQQLFIPPEGRKGMSVRDAVNHYRQWLEEWREGSYLEQSRQVSDTSLILVGIYERLVPQFMLLRSSESLTAQPLLSIESQWHYYTLVTKVFSESLASKGLLNPKTVALLRSLETEKFNWLGNVPHSSLVQLRLDEETKQFRDRLNEFVRDLHSSKLEDIDQVTAEVIRGIKSLLAQHQKRLNAIESKYSRAHSVTLGSGMVTLAALFIPALAPLLGLIPAGAVSLKYVTNKLDERAERKDASQSLMGVLVGAMEAL